MNVYDFDGTIYDGDSTVDFFLYAMKRAPLLSRYIVYQGMGFLLYKGKQISKTRFKEYFFSFLKDIDAKNLAIDFWRGHRKKIFPWYLSQHKADDIIISASPEFLLVPICKEIGIDCLIASKVNCHTGHFIGKNCKGIEKVRRLKTEYNIHHIDQFYSDSLSDLPLAKIANEAFLVKKGKIIPWPIQ